MNLIHHRPDLGQIVMPLVRVMALADLSWADRAKFAQAIQRCCTTGNQWKKSGFYSNRTPLRANAHKVVPLRLEHE